MSASEKTTNLQLPIYKPNDRLSVDDYNDAMQALDSAHEDVIQEINEIKENGINETTPVSLTWTGNDSGGNSLFTLTPGTVAPEEGT